MVALTSTWQKIAVKTRNNCEEQLWARVNHQDAINNRTYVDSEIAIYCPSPYGFDTASWSSTLTGASSTSGGYTDFEGRTVKVISSSIVVTHNANGDGSTTIRGTFTASNSNWNWDSGNISCTLPHINRLATIDAYNVGGSYTSDMAVRYTKHNTSFYNRLRVSVPNVKRLFYIESYNSGTSFSLSDYTVDGYTADEWIERNVTSSETVTIEAVVETWTSSSSCSAGGTPNVGESKKTSTFSIGSAPTLSGYTVIEQNYSDSITIKGRSHKQISVNVQPNLYATISSVKVSSGGCTATLTASGSTYTGYLTGMVGSSSTIDYVLTVADSRGWTSTLTHTEPYYVYSAPSIESCKIKRVPNPSGSDPANPDTEDAIGRIEVMIHYTDVLNNSVVVTASGDLGSAAASGGTGGTFESYIDLPNADYRQAYTVNLTIADTLGSSIPVTLVLAMSIPTMSMFSDEIDMNVPLYIMGSNATPFVDHENKTTFTFSIKNLQMSGVYLTGIMYGCVAATATSGVFMTIVNIDTAKNVTFYNITNKTNRTFTGSVDGTNLTITSSSTLYGGLRLIWLN